MEEEQKKKIQKLIIDLTPDQHSRVKAYAAIRNISMKKWILKAITIAEREEEKSS